MKRHLLLLVLAALTGCAREPRTELIRKLEKAGAGDVRSVTDQSMEQWFQRHPSVAVDVSRICRPLRREAPAKWGDTTDGRICAAAAKAHVFYFRLRPVDGMIFDAGK